MNKHIKQITLGTAAGFIAVGALFLPSVGYSHTNECQLAIPYPGWAQVGPIYSKADGTFFKAIAYDEGIAHIRYTSDCFVSSEVFSPFDKDNDDAQEAVGATESASESRNGTSGDEGSSGGDTGTGGANKPKKPKKPKGNCGNQEGSGTGNGGGNTCG